MRRVVVNSSKNIIFILIPCSIIYYQPFNRENRKKIVLVTIENTNFFQQQYFHTCVQKCSKSLHCVRGDFENVVPNNSIIIGIYFILLHLDNNKYILDTKQKRIDEVTFTNL